MSAPGTRVDVLLSTFRRPAVRETLISLGTQRLPDGTTMRIVVSDNDDTPSARQVVEETAATLPVPVLYQHAPARNISVARNAGLEAAEADWVAFLDDDEIAEPDWLEQLLSCAQESGADAIFGPAIAEYGPGAPAWMVKQDHHSNRPVRRGGEVETGHTCNALLRWGEVPWRHLRFDLARGRAGGEDTAFFFDLHRAGARFEICDKAIVREAVAEGRLSLGWLLRRKYRSGQSHAASAAGLPARAGLALSAAGKGLVCAAGMVAFAWSDDRRNFWLLRGALHLGVISGCLALRQPELYGEAG